MRTRLRTLAIGVVAAAVLAACGGPGTPPAAGGSLGPDTLALVAKNVTFDTTELRAPAGRPFHIRLDNEDDGIPHSVAFLSGSTELWRSDVFNGIETRTFDVPALPAGTYRFVCTVHLGMTGTLTVGP
jgi:plastocyanin